MVHKMHLHSLPFSQIKEGSKTIEARLNDEKRQSLIVGDIIEFTKRPENIKAVQAKIVGLLKFDSFKQLFKARPASQFGGVDIKDLLGSIHKHYSVADEYKYGVVGIEIALFKNITV